MAGQAEPQDAQARLDKKRINIGIIVFLIGQLSTLLTPLVTSSQLAPEWKTILSGMLIFVIPQLLLMAAVAIMGKEGYNHIKALFFKFLRKHGPAQVVSKTRYRIGLVMFLLPILFGWIAPYYQSHIPGYGTHTNYYAMGGDALLIFSLFVLGGEFWDKLRSLFVYRAQAVFPKLANPALLPFKKEK